MSDQNEEILGVLDDLLKLDDIDACIVAQRDMVGIIPDTKKFKKEVLGVWEVLEKTMNEFFGVIEHYCEQGLDKVYFELGKHDVIFFILPGSNTALVAITPSLGSRGLVMIELDKSRLKIIKILEGK